MAPSGRPGTAVVTGASAGIGSCYARRLAARGHDLVLVARRVDRLGTLSRELTARYGVGAEPLVADLRRPEDVHRVGERAAGADVAMLVNNAGINGYAPFAEAAPEVLAAVLQVNAVAPVLLCRAALPGMRERERGAVVNVASVLAFSAGAGFPRRPQRAVYAATKAHLVAFSRILASELAGTGVQVQVVCPGYTATEFHLTHTDAPVREELAAGKPDEPHAMSADDVVLASLRALDDGELICVPGLHDLAALARLLDAEAGLLATSLSAELAGRYRG